MPPSVPPIPLSVTGPLSRPSNTPPVVTRFAPSPTGHLHIGGVRTALFCYAYAKRFGGSFLLRIEDTDQARSSEASTRGILEDLAWCGIYWDQGPEITFQGQHIGGDPFGVGSFYQSQRLAIYGQVIEEMLAQDLAYPAFDSAAELDAQRKSAVERKDTYRYKRAASYDRAAATARLRAGEPGVIRFNNPGNIVRVADDVLGEIKFEPEHTDDFVIRKADGFPTYHFAVVVDDQMMGVTHILRGQEHLNNTPRHVALQLALGYQTPVYAHLPLIFNPDSTKMSKRDKDKAARDAVKKQSLSAAGLGAELLGEVSPAQFQTWIDDKTRQLPADTLRRVAERAKIVLPEIDVDDFRRSGYLPEVLCNYLALLGWNPGMKTPDGKDVEKFDIGFLCEHFDFSRIGKTNSKFDRVKLASFNQDAIAPAHAAAQSPSSAMPLVEFSARWRAWCESFAPKLLDCFPDTTDGRSRFTILGSAVRGRAKTFRDCVATSQFAMMSDDAVAYDAKAVAKAFGPPAAAPAPDQPPQPTGTILLAKARETIAALPPSGFSPESITTALEALASTLGVQIGAIAQTLRVAMTGTGVSPGIGETLACLGQNSTLARIDHCLTFLAVNAPA